MTCNLARRVLAFSACAFVLMVVTGCGGGRGAVSGNVTFDEAPLDGGNITFIHEGSKAQASGEIVGGKYAIPAKFGPAPGKNRVEIRWDKKTGKKVGTPGDDSAPMDQTVQVVPQQYNKASVLTADVKSGGTYDFKVTSK